eukprot:12639557-Alexandrium_andersonii.AAC.1
MATPAPTPTVSASRPLRMTLMERATRRTWEPVRADLRQRVRLLKRTSDATLGGRGLPSGAWDLGVLPKRAARPIILWHCLLLHCVAFNHVLLSRDPTVIPGRAGAPALAAAGRAARGARRGRGHKGAGRP